MKTVDSEPCPEQRALMEDLGFHLSPTSDSGMSVWRFHCIVLRYPNHLIPTPYLAIGHALQEAVKIGEQRRAAAIAKLLS